MFPNQATAVRNEEDGGTNGGIPCTWLRRNYVLTHAVGTVGLLLVVRATNNIKTWLSIVLCSHLPDRVEEQPQLQCDLRFYIEKRDI